MPLIGSIELVCVCETGHTFQRYDWWASLHWLIVTLMNSFRLAGILASISLQYTQILITVCHEWKLSGSWIIVSIHLGIKAELIVFLASAVAEVAAAEVAVALFSNQFSPCLRSVGETYWNGSAQPSQCWISFSWYRRQILNFFPA